MAKRTIVAKVFAPALLDIITAWHLGHWSAWFEDTPQVAFGGDTPVSAVERLFKQWQNERFVKAVKRVEAASR